MYPYSNQQLSPKERAEQSDKIKRAIDIIKGSKVESILDYGVRDGYVNAIFLDDGNEYNFAINTENGRFEYYLSGRKDPFMSSTYPSADPYSYHADPTQDNQDSVFSTKRYGYLRDYTDSDTAQEILENLRNDDELTGEEDLSNPQVRSKLLTEIIESVYGKGGIDRIISYGLKGELIVGQFKASGQDFDFELDPGKGSLDYRPILTAQQKKELEENKDSFDSYAIGQCLAIGQDLGIELPPGKRPEWMQGYLMELSPNHHFF